MHGLEVVGQGATAKIFRDGDTAIKLYENVPMDEVQREARFQTFAHGAGLPVPQVFGVRKIDENSIALDMAYIRGTPLMNAEMPQHQFFNALRKLVELQTAVHHVNAAGLPLQTERLRLKICESTFIADSVKKRLLARLEGLANGETRLCHGDFHPLNVLYDGEKHWIIDWVDTTAGSPQADACRTYLISLQHFPPVADMYLKLFCAEAQVGEQAVLDWLPIVAAARMREQLDDAGRAFLFELANRI